MCKISDEIKFCTCGDNSDYSQLENSWKICRRGSGFRVGQTIFSENSLKIEKTEIENLLHKLKNEKIFDFEYTPKLDDRLKVKLSYKGKSSEYIYKFTKNGWGISDFLENFFDENISPCAEYSGKINNPFNN